MVKPLQPATLRATLTLAWFQLQRFQSACEELVALQQALESRKLIERAKGIVMKRAHLTEEEAFRRLRRLARDRNRRMAEVAQSILLAEETFASEIGKVDGAPSTPFRASVETPGTRSLRIREPGVLS